MFCTELLLLYEGSDNTYCDFISSMCFPLSPDCINWFWNYWLSALMLIRFDGLRPINDSEEWPWPINDSEEWPYDYSIIF
jgi:hypothetical protein